MTQVALHDHHPAHRNLRMLGADLVFQTPFIGEIARKSGAHARLQPRRRAAAVAPARSSACGPRASRASASPTPSATSCSGSAAAASSRRRCAPGRRSSRARSSAPRRSTRSSATRRPLARLFGLPYFPITPTFPWLGPLGLVPLPSKWIIEFGEPIRDRPLPRRRRRRPDARLQPHRPGARDDPADALPPARPAPLGLPLTGRLGRDRAPAHLGLHRALRRRLHRRRRGLARLAVPRAPAPRTTATRSSWPTSTASRWAAARGTSSPTSPTCPFEGRPVYVFTHRDATPRDGVTFWSRTPQEAVAEWQAAGLTPRLRRRRPPDQPVPRRRARRRPHAHGRAGAARAGCAAVPRDRRADRAAPRLGDAVRQRPRHAPLRARLTSTVFPRRR